MPAEKEVCPECGAPVKLAGTWLDLSPRIVYEPMPAALEAARSVWFANDPTPPVHSAILEKLEGRLFNAIRAAVTAHQTAHLADTKNG